MDISLNLLLLATGSMHGPRHAAHSAHFGIGYAMPNGMLTARPLASILMLVMSPGLIDTSAVNTAAVVPVDREAMGYWTRWRGPSGQGTVADGDYPDVPAGAYSLKVATRTTYSDNDTFCVNVILENPSDKVDADWEQMTIDLRAHTLTNFWNSTIDGSIGVVTVTPTAETRTVRALSKTSFGFCLRRSTLTKAKGYAPVLVKTLKW